MNIIFTYNRRSVLLVNSNSGRLIYRIPRYLICQTEKGNVSKWVLEIAKYGWTTGDNLYSLAVIICQLFPDNKIDWETTFYELAKLDHFGDVADLDQLSFDSELEASIRKTISKNLQEYGVLVGDN